MVALCLLRRVDRGAVDLEAPVATYWPEFAQAEKQAITIRQALGGMAGPMYPDHAPEGSILDSGGATCTGPGARGPRLEAG